MDWLILVQWTGLLAFHKAYHTIVLYGEQFRTESVSINLQILIILNGLGYQCRIRKALVKLCQVYITFHIKDIASVHVT
jgi:hypothetical protein